MNHPTSRPATVAPAPDVAAPGGTKHASGQASHDAPVTPAAGAQPADRPVGPDTHRRFAVGSTPGPDPAADGRPAPIDVSLLDPALALAADVLDDIERVRTANENRLRQMTRRIEDSDGERRGLGYDETHPDVARLAAIVDMLRKVEHDATLQLQRQLRRHPLGAWVKATKGVGEKQGARLLAAIGDPYINSAKGEPRTVSALWAYCGLDPRDGAARKRKRGEKSNWSTRGKTRAYLISEACMKQLSPHCRTGQVISDDRHAVAGPAVRHIDTCACSPYRLVYDQRRAHTAISRPDCTDGHSHNDALRVASKEILKDLWRAARDWHHRAEPPS